MLNLAEGAGKLSKPDKRRYYVTARGSATESAALLDVCLRLRLLRRGRIIARQGARRARLERATRSCRD
ncbi:MAG: four helix bundle protein [Labilithrix sp.]|nr:four helix bundle protein [Labilithrix sp.]